MTPGTGSRARVDVELLENAGTGSNCEENGELHLHGNDIGNEGIRALMSGLAAHRGKITLLDIGNNDIGSKGAFHVAEFIKKTKFLLWLNLYMNDIGDKAWFRELPSGVLDSLTPDQVMHCNTEEECSQLARMLPPMEAALLDWAINLMADVVEHEHSNKMNARNIALAFSPNMTQMADPLTALIHAVQVMNFLKTLIIKTLQEREEASAATMTFHPCSESPSDKDDPNLTKPIEKSSVGSNEKVMDMCLLDRAAFSKFLYGAEHAPDGDVEESFQSSEKSDISEDREFISGKSSPVSRDLNATKGFHPFLFSKHEYWERTVSSFVEMS